MKKIILIVLSTLLFTSCATFDVNLDLGFKDKEGNSYKIGSQYNEDKHGIELGGEVKGVDFECFIAYEKKNKGEKLNIETDFSLFEQSGLIKVTVNGQLYGCEVKVDAKKEADVKIDESKMEEEVKEETKEETKEEVKEETKEEVKEETKKETKEEE